MTPTWYEVDVVFSTMEAISGSQGAQGVEFECSLLDVSWYVALA